jgi:hypothetical protein
MAIACPVRLCYRDHAGKVVFFRAVLPDTSVIAQNVQYAGRDECREFWTQHDILHAKVQQGKEDKRRLLLVLCNVIGDRQLLDPNTRCLGKRLRYNNQRAAVIALAGIDDAGSSAHGAEVETIVSVLGAACRQDDRALR